MNKGVKTRTTIVISGRIFWGLIFRCMAKSACKRYVLQALDIFVMNAESIFSRKNFESETNSFSRVKSLYDFLRLAKFPIKKLFEILIHIVGVD